MTRIPVRNLWLLQLFASDLYRTAGTQLSGIESLPEDVAQLVSRMLADAVSDRLRTGLTVGFHRRTDDLGRVRGKIDILGTERHRLLERGKVRCTFDETYSSALLWNELPDFLEQTDAAGIWLANWLLSVCEMTIPRCLRCDISMGSVILLQIGRC